MGCAVHDIILLVYNGHLRGPMTITPITERLLTLTPIADRLLMELLLFILFYSNTQPSTCGVNGSSN